MDDTDFEKLRDIIISINAEGKGGKFSTFLQTALGGLVAVAMAAVGLHTHCIKTTEFLDIDFPKFEKSVELIDSNCKGVERRVTRLEWIHNPELATAKKQ